MLSLFLSLALLDVSGEWRNVDVMSIESVPGYCMRVWVEERTWDLDKTWRNRVRGTYRNVIRGIPVGSPSRKETCKWPAPATKAASAQIRLWPVAGRPAGDDHWSIAAAEGTTTGELRRDQAFPFTTTVERKGDTLLSADTPQPRVFRPAGRPAPAAAVAALQKAIDEVHSDRCVEVIRSIGFDKQESKNSCALRKLIQKESGEYQSMSIEQALEFDRAPLAFPASSSLKQQHGVLFHFVAKYEKYPLPGNAILYEENGKWKLASLWL
jgi:hypothetical protein